MAVRFDAVNDQLGRTTDLPDYNGVYTWMGHFYLTADTNATGAAMVITNADGTSYDFIGVSSDGTSLVVDGGASGVNVQALSLGTWYTIAMVRSSDTSLIGYCYDGATLNSGTDTVDVSARGALTSMVTGGALGTYLWNGRTSCQKLWNRALTSAEILNEARTIRVQDPTSLYAWWPMFAGSAEYIKDYSGNGRDFTAGGTLTEEQEPPLSYGSNIISFPYAAGGVTGTIAASLASFSSTLTGTTTVTGSVANTLSAFVSAITGTPTVTGSIGGALSDFNSSIAGTTTVHGSIASTLNAFASSIQGTTTVNGAIANTLDPFTSSISGTAGSAIGTISAFLGSFTANIVGRHNVVMRQDSSGGKRRKSKKSFLIQDDLYEQRIKVTAEAPDSIHPPVKPQAVSPGQRKPAAKITDIKPAVSQIVTDEDVELVLMVLDALDEAA